VARGRGPDTRGADPAQARLPAGPRRIGERAPAADAAGDPADDEGIDRVLGGAPAGRTVAADLLGRRPRRDRGAGGLRSRAGPGGTSQATRRGLDAAGGVGTEARQRSVPRAG